jgi:hypothetical protein
MLVRHHLTFPSLRDGPLPLPRFAAERSLERMVILLYCAPGGMWRFSSSAAIRRAVIAVPAGAGWCSR